MEVVVGAMFDGAPRLLQAMIIRARRRTPFQVGGTTVVLSMSAASLFLVETVRRAHAHYLLFLRSISRMREKIWIASYAVLRYDTSRYLARKRE